MKFNPSTALIYAECLARPRRVGSIEEKLVAAELKELLTYFGYQVTEHEFTLTNAQNSVIALLLIINLLVIGGAIGFPQYAAVSGIAMFSLFILFPKILKAAEHRMIAEGRNFPHWFLGNLGKTYTTHNLIGKLPNSVKAKTQLYLIAHYDSKSQFMPIMVRIGLFIIVLSGSLGFALLTFFASIFPTIPILTMLGIILSLASLPLIFIDVGNDSPGAIDNASGVGTVLHLAEIITQRAELNQNLAVTVLLPSAEEMALLGAAAYVKYRLPPPPTDKTIYVLNFDGVGVAGKLRYVDAHNKQHPSPLLQLIQAACTELDVALDKFVMIGALMDHIPFAQAGYDALSLTAFSRTQWWVHTAYDSADKLEVAGFAQAGEVALRVIEKIAAQNNDT